MVLPCVPAAYKLTDKDTGSFYIGSTTNLRARIATHRSTIRRGTGASTQVQNALLDWDRVEIEYIETKDIQAANRLEDSLLDFHRDDDGLLNTAVSGNVSSSRYISGNILKATRASTTESSRQTRSEKLKGVPKTLETRQRMSDSARARGNNFSQEGIAKGRAKRSQPIIVDGVTYESSRAAGRAHGVCEHTAKKRANSPNFPNWSFGPKD